MLLLVTFLVMVSGGTSRLPSGYGFHWLLAETSSCPLSRMLLCCDGVYCKNGRIYFSALTDHCIKPPLTFAPNPPCSIAQHFICNGNHFMLYPYIVLMYKNCILAAVLTALLSVDLTLNGRTLDAH